MKKLVKRVGGKILSIIYRPIINLLLDQNNISLDQKNILQQQKDSLMYIELMKNDFVYSLYYKKRDLSERILIKFWVPDFKHEYIQRGVVDNQSLFAIDSLIHYDQYIKDESIILDIGGNIGSHSLYWALIRNAKQIIAFEPYAVTAEHFMKNVMLNELEQIISINKVGLGNKDQRAKGMPMPEEMGLSAIQVEEDGDIEVRALDNMKLDVPHIDLIKIDVEEMEYLVLQGAIETIKKHKPTLIIEVHLGEQFEERYNKINSFLENLGYDFMSSIVDDFIFVHKDKINK